MSTYKEGDLQVWYIPQVPMKPFTVDVPDMATAVLVEETLARFSEFEFDNNVKPDYSDAGGIQRYESNGDGGFDWYAVEEDE